MGKKYSLMTSMIILLMSCFLPNLLWGQPQIFDLTLQTRDAETNQVINKAESADVSKIGIIIVDPWNYHWCMTATERVSAMIPRWNKILEVARKIHIPIIFCPSDVIGSYSGYLQRENVLALELLNVPKERDMPDTKWTAPVGACLCGPGISCKVNYGFDNMHPALFLDDDDFIASSTEEVYTLLSNRDLTHIIYMGLHTNMCLYNKPGAMKHMWQAGFNCMLARDCNDAFTSYDPGSRYTPDMGTGQIDEDLERAGIPTINLVDELQNAGLWNDDKPYETVRIAPWGMIERPYFFIGKVTVTLSVPWLKDVKIYYTLDGSQPTANSALYKGPLTFATTTELRTAAFRGAEMVSIPTEAYFVSTPPDPPKPDIYLDKLEYIIDPYGQTGPVYAACLWLPETGKSYANKNLRIRGKVYEKGLGFRAPSSVRYKLDPRYERFVAKAGVDDNMLDNELGRNLAMYPSVIFSVFIDGKKMAESPVMRISQEPWRFNVEIPDGSRYINLVCTDAGTRNTLDLGNWIDAGFTIK